MNTRLALNQIARRQHALITRDQALASGLSPFQVRQRIRSGEWCTVRPGVYAVNGAPPTWLQAVAAVALGPRMWISHQTAGSLWALPGVGDDAIHVVTSLDRWVRLAGVHGHRSGALFTADLTTRHQITVTTPARTLVDLSARLSLHQLARAVDDALRRRILTLQALDRCVARLTGAPGRRRRRCRSSLPSGSPATTRATVTSRPGSCAWWWAPAFHRRSSSTASKSEAGLSRSISRTRHADWHRARRMGVPSQPHCVRR